MSSIKVNFEISHEATRRSKDTPEGFTHDWEVVVRGQEGADISHFVDKVVFNLHNSFPKPRRVVKEPPFSVKESGYAGFSFPIEIHLKNKNEPKKIQFHYNLTFQPCGSLRDRYIFQNPNDEFRRKLLKGGGIIVNNDSFYTNPDQESRSRDSFTNEKPQLVSKPKLSSENIKKHKTKEKIKDEVPHKTNSFENLFGAPIQKPPKVSPDPKRIEKSVIKTEKKEKDRSSEKKSKHEHKEIKTEKIKVKEEREKQKSEKVKSISKDSEKVKEKSNKRPSERPPSPDLIKKKCVSPVRKPPSPVQMSNASIKEEYRSSSKNNVESFDQKKVKVEDRPSEVKVEKEKKKKDKKSHDRDKDRKDKKEHKKESHKNKESPKDVSKIVNTSKDSIKEREPIKDSQPKEKPPKPDKPVNKFSIENLKKTPPSANEERLESHKVKEKTESERKHKHKKKDKKRDESREKHKESSKEKKRKHDKVREVPQDKPEHIELRDTPVPKEHLITETASPISVDSASQSSESKSGLTKPSIKVEDNSSHSESEDSVIADDEDVKVKVETHSPEPVKREPTPEPEPELEPEPEPELETEPVPEPPPVQQKEKSKKHKDKSKREEKRRKRKAAEEEDSENRKIAKAADPGPANHDNEHGESSGSISIETKVQDNGVSSSLGEDGESGDLSPDYMVQLRGLQQRIMMIKNNEDLERVVNLIAETGRYEVTTQTFDFDLCLLDRSTVQQLIQLVGC